MEGEPPAIKTHCPSCGNDGITPAPGAGAQLEAYLQLLRDRCPDCGTAGRTVEVLAGEPDDPELADVLRQMRAFDTFDSDVDLGRFQPKPRSRPASVGCNEPCPCGSGNKYKRCCGRL